MFGNNNSTPQTGGQDSQSETAREEKIINEIAKLRSEVNNCQQEIQHNRGLLERLQATLRKIEGRL